MLPSTRYRSPSPQFSDVFDFFEAIKAKYPDNPDIYNQFQDIMKDFDRYSNNISLINRVITLFSDHLDLIKAFNSLLPYRWRVIISEDPSNPDVVNITSPHGIPLQTLNRNLQTEVAPAPHESNYGYDLIDKANFLGAVKDRYADNPEIYNQYLGIMKEYRNGGIEPSILMDRVISLFAGHTDLINAFNTFLPRGYYIDILADVLHPEVLTLHTPFGIITKVSPNGTKMTTFPPDPRYCILQYP